MERSSGLWMTGREVFNRQWHLVRDLQTGVRPLHFSKTWNRSGKPWEIVYRGGALNAVTHPALSKLGVSSRRWTTRTKGYIQGELTSHVETDWEEWTVCFGLTGQRKITFYEHLSSL